MKFYKSDLFLKIVSLLVSILIWFYVVYQENPEIDKWVPNLPVVQRSLSQDFSNGELVVTSMSVNEVDVKVSGRRRVIASAKSSTGEAYIDMSNITDAGVYELPINIKFHIDGIEVVRIKQNRCKIVVERVDTQERTIIVNNYGTVAEGYVWEGNTIEPTTVKLRGPRSALSEIASCSITVNIDGMNKSVTGDKYKIKFYDNKGEEITEPYAFRSNVEYTDLTCNIAKKKSVKLNVAMKSSVNANGEIVHAESQRSSVELKGDPKVIEKLSEVYTEAIDVKDIYENVELECALSLPEGVSVIDSEDNTVNVKLSVVK